MAEHQPTSLAVAIEFALAILEPFTQSYLYDDYQNEDGWTDDQFYAAMDVLKSALAKEEPAQQDYFVVESAGMPRPSSVPKL